MEVGQLSALGRALGGGLGATHVDHEVRQERALARDELEESQPAGLRQRHQPRPQPRQRAHAAAAAAAAAAAFGFFLASFAALFAALPVRGGLARTLARGRHLAGGFGGGLGSGEPKVADGFEQLLQRRAVPVHLLGAAEEVAQLVSFKRKQAVQGNLRDTPGREVKRVEVREATGEATSESTRGPLPLS